MGNMLELAKMNLSSPVVLFFALGLIMTMIKAKVEIPKAISDFLSIYLLTAIGFKGGAAIVQYGINTILIKIFGALFLGAIIPVLSYYLLRWLGKFSIDDAAAIAGHYGSVSVVTFMTGSIFLTNLQVPYEGYINGFPAIMEIPGVAVALLLASWANRTRTKGGSGEAATIWQVLNQVVLSKSVILLLGALAVGYLSGPTGMEMMQFFYQDIFYGMLGLFMLELGIIAADKLGEFKKSGLFLLLFGSIFPIITALIGVCVGIIVDLSLGGVTLLSILAASSSYIAAPAAMRISLPKANPALYLGVSIGVTLPFNLIFGIPLYYYMATYLMGKFML